MRTLPVALAVVAGLADRRATADDATPSAAPGEVIVVTGLRLPRPVRDVPAAVTVLDRHEIDRSPHSLADDLLRSLPSAGTFRRSSSLIADPTSQGLNLRGVGPSAVSRALVLRDGVPASDPFGGWMYWRAVTPLALARIELVPSGSSALFGDAALGGVADLISRPIGARELAIELAAGTLGTTRLSARAAHRFGQLAASLDGELFRTTGYAPIAPAQRGPIDGNASSSHGAIGARVSHVRGRSTSHVAVRWFEQALEAGTEHTAAEVRAATYGAGWRLTRGGSTVRLELFGGAQRLRQERARVAPDRSTAALASRQDTPSNHQGGLATWQLRAGTHALLIGLDGRRVAGTATDRLSPADAEPDALVERTAGGEQRFAGLFAQDVVRLGSWGELAAALRLDGWQARDGVRALERASGAGERTELPERTALQLDPRLGLHARLSGELALRGSVYRAFRAPTLNELYRPFQVGTVLTAANDRLRPEVLWGAEAGPQLVVRELVVRATGFWNLLDDAIANVTLDAPLDGATRQRQNLGRARVAGLELDASWRPHPVWTLALAHTYADARVTAAPRRPELVGKRLAQDPRHRTTGSIAFDDPRFATITGQIRYLGAQYEDDLEMLPIGAVVLVDARIARALGNGLTAFASVLNLFDRRYLVGRAGIDTLGAPRIIELGLRFETW
ncbi:MAG: TonB-dependent receptor [Kofleriaceae bacterium]